MNKHWKYKLGLSNETLALIENTKKVIWFNIMSNPQGSLAWEANIKSEQAQLDNLA